MSWCRLLHWTSDLSSSFCVRFGHFCCHASDLDAPRLCEQFVSDLDAVLVALLLVLCQGDGRESAMLSFMESSLTSPVPLIRVAVGAGGLSFVDCYLTKDFLYIVHPIWML